MALTWHRLGANRGGRRDLPITISQIIINHCLIISIATITRFNLMQHVLKSRVDLPVMMKKASADPYGQIVEGSPDDGLLLVRVIAARRGGASVREHAEQRSHQQLQLRNTVTQSLKNPVYE